MPNVFSEILLKQAVFHLFQLRMQKRSSRTGKHHGSEGRMGQKQVTKNSLTCLEYLESRIYLSRIYLSII